MSETQQTALSGSCLCGKVRFEITPPTTFCAHCHCSMCRRNHGAGFVTWFGVPSERFALTAGADRLAKHASSEHGSRSFCRDCGSSLFCESTKHSHRVDVTLASMHGAIDRAPQMHVYFSDRADWVEIDDELPKLGGASGLEAL